MRTRPLCIIKLANWRGVIKSCGISVDLSHSHSAIQGAGLARTHYFQRYPAKDSGISNIVGKGYIYTIDTISYDIKEIPRLVRGQFSCIRFL